MEDMALAKEWLDREVKHPENTTQNMADFIASIRAEARAEALKKASDRAIDWYVRTWKVSPVGPCADELRAAILADEPKEERGVEVGDIVAWMRDEYDEGVPTVEIVESEDRARLLCKATSRRFRILMRRAEVARKLKEAER